MRTLILVVALGLVASPAVLAKNPQPGHGIRGQQAPPITRYVLDGTLSHYAAVSGGTKGSITIAVQTSKPKALAGQTLTFAIDTSTVVSLYGGQTIADGQYGTVVVRAPRDANPATLQTFAATRVAVRTAPHYPTVLYVLRGTVVRYAAPSGTTNGSIALTVRSSNFDRAALGGTTLTFAVGPSTRITLHQAKPIAAGDRAVVKVKATKHSTAAALQTHPAAQIIDQGSAF